MQTFADQVTHMIGARRIIVRISRGSRGYAYLSQRKVTIPRRALNEVYLLHEIAHILIYDKEDRLRPVASHGPEYVRVYHDLLEAFTRLEHGTLATLIANCAVAMAGATEVPRRAAAGAPSAPTRDPRLPPFGTVLKRRYKGIDYEIRVLENGFMWAGELYGSLSALAREISGQKSVNGFLWFGLKK